MSEDKKNVEFINESDLEFTDISSEKAREYANEKGVFCYIDKPLKLHVSKSGGHRVFTANNECYYVRPDEGWYIRWMAKEGEANFVK